MPGLTPKSEVAALPVSILPTYTPPLLSRLPRTKLNVSSDVSLQERKGKVGYTDSHLPSIDTASLALHQALYRFQAVNAIYASIPYQDAFNWSELSLPEDLEREWYIVAFRSTRNLKADGEELYKADREAHEEAVTAGGLLLYWYGAPNAEGKNLATCIWQSRAAALAAMRNPKHAIAAKLASVMYDRYTLERYILRKVRGSTNLEVVPWDGRDVGY